MKKDETDEKKNNVKRYLKNKSQDEKNTLLIEKMKTEILDSL